jgi:alanyl-tRNA synthetase
MPNASVRYATPVHGRSVVMIRLLVNGKGCQGEAEHKTCDWCKKNGKWTVVVTYQQQQKKKDRLDVSNMVMEVSNLVGGGGGGKRSSLLGSSHTHTHSSKFRVLPPYSSESFRSSLLFVV